MREQSWKHRFQLPDPTGIKASAGHGLIHILEESKMVDAYEDIDDRDVVRCSEAARLCLAIRRTEQKLASPAAADPVLRATWASKHARQTAQLRYLL